MNRALFSLFMLATLFFVPAHVAHAQKQAAHIGILYLGIPPNANFDTFVEELRELSHNEGKNIIPEYRYAQGQEERLPELAAELVRLKVDAIFTAGTPSLLALKQATKTIPDRFLQYERSDWNGRCREFGASGWQHHWYFRPRLGPLAQATGAA